MGCGESVSSEILTVSGALCLVSDIPVIPELEDQAEEDLSTKVATAPK